MITYIPWYKKNYNKFGKEISAIMKIKRKASVNKALIGV